MRYLSVIIVILASTSFLFADELSARDGSLFQQRMSRRHQVVSTQLESGLAESDYSMSALQRRAEGLFSDLKINTDNLSSTFDQRNCDIAHFADGKGVVVWEDERNGIWRIAAQPINLSGAAVGANRFLDGGVPPVTLQQSRVAANAAGIVVIIYLKGSDNGLYGRTYDYSLGSGGAEFRIDDATPGNFINQPEIALISGNRFVVVWEDSRDGSNIFAQLLSSNGAISGGNFQVNADLDSPYRIAPAVVSTLAGDFGVVWEDGRSGNGDVYFRIFTDVGTPLFPELLLDATFASDYQFMPKLTFLKGTGYLAVWISDRNGGQSVYGQLISTSSAPIGSTFRVNDSDTDVCWDLNTEGTADSGAVCVWAEYSTTASIEIQKINKNGATVGGNSKLEDSGLLRERAFPAIARGATGFTAVWVDQRNGNLDLFAQRLSSSLEKTNSNYIINDDVNGAQQLAPGITGITSSTLALVWQDRRTDQGDIMLQILSSSGTPLGFVTKVNDDLGTAIQKNPQVGAAGSGVIWTVWEDARTSGGLQGQNILAQKFNGTGVAQGANILVNDDGTSRPKSFPDLDVIPDGRAVCAWIDERDNSRQIYAQGYSSNGATLGSNFRVTNATAMTENFEPHIAARNDGSFVVTWLSIIDGRKVAYFQRYSSPNVPSGTVHMIEIDTANVQILDVDICANYADHRFYVATVENENGQINIKMYGYDAVGVPITGAVTVTDVPGSYSDVRITTDVDDGILITWLKSSTTGNRGQMQVMRNDGFALGGNLPTSASALNRVESSPVGAMIGGYYFIVWADNRNANAGFDVFVNSLQYTGTDSEDEIDVVLPRGFELQQNFPNPFNPETTISYSLQNPGFVRLTLYNLLGQEVCRLVDEYQQTGDYEVIWNPTANEYSAASGIYFYRLSVGTESLTRKMTLLK